MSVQEAAKAATVGFVDDMVSTDTQELEFQVQGETEYYVLLFLD